MSQYFPEPYERFGANVKVELNLTQQGGLPERSNRYWYICGGIKNRFGQLKTKVDNIDVDKLNINVSKLLLI